MRTRTGARKRVWSPAREGMARSTSPETVYASATCHSPTIKPRHSRHEITQEGGDQECFRSFSDPLSRCNDLLITTLVTRSHRREEIRSALDHFLIPCPAVMIS